MTELQDLSDAELRQYGFSARRLRRLDGYLREAVDSGIVPGVCLGLARADHPAVFLTHGVRSLERNDRLSTDSVYRIASLTKPVVSIAALLLAARGSWRLDDPVADYFPEIEGMRLLDGEPLQQPMTLLHLLTHTAGFGYDFNVPAGLVGSYNRVGVAQSLQTTHDFALWLTRLPLLFQPGHGWHYGYSTDLLGYLVELVGGQPLDVFLRENIFLPLQMHDTGFSLQGVQRERYVSLYRYSQDKGFRLLDSPQSSSVFNSNRVCSGGGGLLSSPADYMKFVRMLNGFGRFQAQGGEQQLVSETAVEAMAANCLPMQYIPYTIGAGIGYDTEGYGFGYNVRTLVNPRVKSYLASEGEFGWAGSNNTYFWVDPHRDLGVVVFTHVVPFAWFPLEQEVKQHVYSALVA